MLLTLPRIADFKQGAGSIPRAKTGLIFALDATMSRPAQREGVDVSGGLRSSL
jgi:hypothetical protein